MESSNFNCKHSSDDFCYVCGNFVPKGSRKSPKKYDIASSHWFADAYKEYFEGYSIAISDLEKPWVPRFVCSLCYTTLNRWYRGEKRWLHYSSPRTWLKPRNHEADCFFCAVQVGHGKAITIYPDLPSSAAPKLRETGLENPIRKLPEAVLSSSTLESESVPSVAVSEYRIAEVRSPHYPNQKEIDDLVRDLSLTKANAELLISRLKEWELLDGDVKITTQRKRHEPYSSFFTYKDGLCFCHDVGGLFDEMGLKHEPKEWRLFIDSSSKSLKAVLLHNGNEHPSIPVAHSKLLKENYDSTKLLMDSLHYSKYCWEVIGDFKMIAFLMGLQGGFTKFPCFLCHWDSRSVTNHFSKRHWDERKELKKGEHNVKELALVQADKILMPPLHIKLGLVKQFIKALDKESAAFTYILKKFPKLSDAKITAGVLTGPQVREMVMDAKFEKNLSSVQKAAWKSFKDICENFLGNHKSNNYQEIVENLVKNFGKMGCRMSLKLHILDSHLDKFKENMGAYSEEHGERFHQDIRKFESRYNKQCDEAMMGDYIWNLMTSIPGTSSKRQSSRKTIN